MKLFVGSSVVTRHWRAKPLRADGVLRRQADLGIGQRHALGDEDLRLDDVDASHFLGDRVLDLNSRIDFDEVELVRVAIDEELDGAGVLVLHRPADLDRGIADRCRDAGIEVRRRRDFHHLLMPPLHGAIPLVEMDQIAVLVAEKLHLDVAGLGDELLDEHVGAAEGGERFPLGLLERRRELLLALDHPHAASAAPLGRLEMMG